MLNVTAIILAAGASRRLGFNKLCVRIDGESVIRRTTGRLAEAGIKDIIVVTGFEAERVEQELSGLSVRIAHNERYDEGMSGSVRIAMPLLGPDTAALFHLGDKPFIEAGSIRGMVQAYEARRCAIVIAGHKGIMGHPVLLQPARHALEIAGIRGDRGLRDIVEAHAEDLCVIECGEGAILDVDTREDLESLRRRGFTVEED
jgi:molybdenum cofactor cytidylyltransferase